MEINNCPSCGGKVEFSPKDKAQKCVKCGRVYEIEYKTNINKRPISEASGDEGYKEWENSSRSFRCSNCGAQVVLDKYDMTNKCQYCHTSTLVPLESLPGLKPDKVLPFKISKEEAVIVFRERVKKKFFLPNEFKKKLPTADLGATYISAFNFACFASANYHGLESYTKTVFENGQSRTITRQRPISGRMNHQFDNIVIEVSDKINQSDISSILPYNFKQAYDYDSGFIKGYSVGYYNRTVAEAFNQAKVIAERDIERMIRSKYDNVEMLSVKTTFRNESYNYSLLPIYFVNYSYKNKQYTNLMNGQNGNVGGKMPKSAVKITFIVLLALLVVVGIPLLIVLLSM